MTRVSIQGRITATDTRQPLRGAFVSVSPTPEEGAASALDHPNICTIHEIDETADGQLYLVMAHYEGETLKERIARASLRACESG